MSSTIQPVITRPRIRIASKPTSKPGKETLENPSPITLTEYRFDIEIRGLICLVSVTAKFYNSLSREVEGELEFPLPYGVSISGFALDINGVMVDASCVAKEKARVVFETEKRKRVDPGLVEHVEGNIFRTKIYPLPANGSRTVRIDWIQTVRWNPKKESVEFRTPVCFDQPVDYFELNVDIIESAIIPKFKDFTINLSKQWVTDFDKTSDGWTCFHKWENFQPESDLVIDIPNMNLEPIQAENTDDGTYCTFVVQKEHLDPQNWPWHDDVQFENKVPESDFATIYWDCSASARPAANGKNRQLDFLSQWIRQSKIRGMQIVPVRNAIDMAEVKTFFLLDSENNSQTSSSKQEVHYKPGNNDNKIFHAIYMYDCGTVLQFRKQPGQTANMSIQASKGSGEIDKEGSVEYIGPAKPNLSDKASWAFDMTFYDRKAMADKVVETLENLPYDGSSRMDNITSFQRNREYISSPFCGLGSRSLSMLFTDGMVNPSDPAPKMIHMGNLYTFSAGVKCNAPLLRRWAAEANGLYFNLNNVETQQAVEQFLQFQTQQWNQYSVSGDSADVFPKTIYNDDQPFAICFCKVENEDARINVHVDSTSEISYSIDIPKECFKDSDEEDEGDVFPSLRSQKKGESRHSWTDCTMNRECPIRALYAQAKLDELMGAPKRNAKKIRKLGKRYSLVTPETSLIVLENLDQYVQHNISPPRSLPEMIVEFWNIQLSKDAEKKEKRKKKRKIARLKYLKEIWEERVEWWEKEWSKLPFKKDEPADDAVPSGRRRTGVPVPLRNIESEAPDENEPRSESLVLHDIDYDMEEMIAHSEFFARNTLEPSTASTLCRGSAYCNCRESNISRHDQPEDDSADENTISVHITPWESDSKYLAVLNASTSIDEAYPAYLELCDKYGSAPSFYLECAHWFYSHDAKELALRILSNLEELNLDDPQLLRALAHRLELWGELEDAIRVYRRVKKMRPEEPQSYRDLALALAKSADALISDEDDPEAEKEIPKERLKLYSKALSLLKKTIFGRRYKDWDERYPEIEVIALEEFNALLARTKELGCKAPSKFPKELIKLLDCDIRIVMTWHADDTDIDLHVTEPTDETAYYGNHLTKIGGLVSEDFMDGYGPEEYLIRRAVPGKYVVKAHYFGSSAVEILGEVCVQADVFTNFGRPNQTVQSLDFSLKDEGDEHVMGEIEFKE